MGINSKDLNDKAILDAGYTEYEPSLIDTANVTKCFSKWFWDAFGKRYAIHIKKWDWTNIDPSMGIKYEFEVQVAIDEKPINITLFSGWDVEEVENYMERLWSQGTYDYYERWSEA